MPLRILNLLAFAVVALGCAGAFILAMISILSEPAYSIGQAIGAVLFGYVFGMPYLTASWALAETSAKRRLSSSKWNIANIVLLTVAAIFMLSQNFTGVVLVIIAIAAMISALNMRSLVYTSVNDTKEVNQVE